jgi:hypothetical protein
MLTDADWTRLTRYVVGECAPAIGDLERAWIAADPERRAIADVLFDLRSASPGPAPEWNADRVWARLRDSAAVGAGGIRSLRSVRRAYPLIFPRRERTRRRWWVSRVAAVMLVLVGGVSMYWVSRGMRAPVTREVATRHQRFRSCIDQPGPHGGGALAPLPATKESRGEDRAITIRTSDLPAVADTWAIADLQTTLFRLPRIELTGRTGGTQACQ